MEYLRNLSLNPPQIITKEPKIVLEIGTVGQVTEEVPYSSINYNRISTVFKSIGDNFNVNKKNAPRLMFEALDRLIKRNEGSFDGLINFLYSAGLGNSAKEFKEYIEKNPNITFSEMYEKFSQVDSSWRLKLSILDPSISNDLHLSGAISLNGKAILTEVEKILSEKNNTLSLTPPQPSRVVESQTKINGEDKKFIFQAIRLYQITIGRELTSLGVPKTTIPELLKCNNQTEIQSYLVNLDDFAQKSIPQKLQICKSRVEGALEFLKLPDNVIQDLLKCGSELELQTYLQNI
jgi:hypothetical protein